MINNNEIIKKYNKIIKDARRDSKLDFCLCCHKHVSSFCNSHSLPKLVLKNLSDMGLILNSNYFFENVLIKDKKGLNNSGTFHRICNECDNILFRDYEDENRLIEPPRKKIMAQIDLKNSLRMYDKRLNEIASTNILINTADEIYFEDFVKRQMINFLDLKEIKIDFQRSLDILNKKSTSSYELIYWKLLDYVTPIGFQGHIALVGDLNGGMINDIYNYSSKNRIESINLAVFPLKENTVVMMFVSKEYKKYKFFIHQFKRLNEEEKLRLISYIICNYSEDFFISPKTKIDILVNKDIKTITKNVTDIEAFDEENAKQLKRNKFLELKSYNRFPNLLGRENALIVHK